MVGNDRPDVILDLERLKNNCSGNMEIVVELLRHLYQKSGPRWFSALEEGLLAENSEELREVCHAMKGASATVFAWRISNMALEFEHLARDENIQEMSNRMGELKNSFLEFEEWVKTNLE